MSITTRRAWFLVSGLLGLGLGLGSCGKIAPDGLRIDSNTNWLMRCQEDNECTGSLRCYCGICTKPCGQNDECGLLYGAQCAESGEVLCGEQASAGGLCVLGCSLSIECGDGFDCTQGQCVPQSSPPTAPLPDPAPPIPAPPGPPPPCTPLELRCDGAQLRRCNATRTGYDTVSVCASAALCDPVAGKCLPQTCAPGELRCSEERLELCESGVAWSLVDTCRTACACELSAQLGVSICINPDCLQGETRCSSSVLQACDPCKSAFVDVADCGSSNLCDPVQGRCLDAPSADAGADAP